MPYIISTPIQQTQSYYNDNFLLWQDGTVNVPPYIYKGNLYQAGDSGDLVISGSVSTGYVYASSLAGFDLAGVVYSSQYISVGGYTMSKGSNLVYTTHQISTTTYLPPNPTAGDYVYYINNPQGTGRLSIVVNGNGNYIFNLSNATSSTITTQAGLFYWNGTYWYYMTN